MNGVFLSPKVQFNYGPQGGFSSTSQAVLGLGLDVGYDEPAKADEPLLRYPRRNVILMLMAIELMLLAVNLNFIAFSRYLGDMAGQVFVFFILTVAAAESAIGLAILVLLFRNTGSIDVEAQGRLRG